MELMITLTIVGITATFAVPSMTAFIRSQRISTQANELVADLAFAKSEAGKRSDRNVVICGTAIGGGACLVAPADRSNYTNGRLIFVDTPNATGAFDNTYNLADGDVILKERLRLDGASTATQGNVLQGLIGPSNPILIPIVFSGAQRGAVTQGTGSYMVCVDQAAATGREIVFGASGQPRIQKFGELTYINSCT